MLEMGFGGDVGELEEVEMVVGWWKWRRWWRICEWILKKEMRVMVMGFVEIERVVIGIWWNEVEKVF